MIQARTGAHHIRERSEARHQQLDGIDLIVDSDVGAAGETAVAVALADLDGGRLMTLRGPASDGDDSNLGDFSPFVPMRPPALAFGRAAMIQALPAEPVAAEPPSPAETQPPAEPPPVVPETTHLLVAELTPPTPEPPVPEPPVTPEPTVTPEPAPVVTPVVVVPVVATPDPPPPSPPPPLIVVAQSVTAPPPAVIAAAPEPASWIMMVLGFGGLGAILRWRRGRTSGRHREPLA